MPAAFPLRCEEDNGAIWLTTSHDGYRERFGLVHRRRLYFPATGDNLRGEDTLVTDGPHKEPSRPFFVRFHLHPDVKASLVQNGAGVLLRLPSGDGWRFQSSGGFRGLRRASIWRTEKRIVTPSRSWSTACFSTRVRSSNGPCKNSASRALGRPDRRRSRSHPPTAPSLKHQYGPELIFGRARCTQMLLP